MSEFVVAAERLPELRAVHPDASVEPRDRRRRRRAPRARGRATRRSSSCCAAAWRSSGRRPRARSPASLGDRRGRRRRGAARARSRRRRAARDSFEPDRRLQPRPHRMVRPPAARAHPSLHAEPAARRDRAGQRRPTSCGSCSPGSTSTPAQPADRRRRPARGRRALDGFELAADAWERVVLPARVDGYEPSMLDMLVPHRRGRLGAAVAVGARSDADGRRDADRAVPARARRRVGRR